MTTGCCSIVETSQRGCCRCGEHLMRPSAWPVKSRSPSVGLGGVPPEQREDQRHAWPRVTSSGFAPSRKAACTSCSCTRQLPKSLYKMNYTEFASCSPFIQPSSSCTGCRDFFYQAALRCYIFSCALTANCVKDISICSTLQAPCEHQAGCLSIALWRQTLVLKYRSAMHMHIRHIKLPK